MLMYRIRETTQRQTVTECIEVDPKAKYQLGSNCTSLVSSLQAGRLQRLEDVAKRQARMRKQNHCCGLKQNIVFGPQMKKSEVKDKMRKESRNSPE